MKNTNLKGKMLNRRAQITISMLILAFILFVAVIGQIGQGETISWEWFENSPFFYITFGWLGCTVVMSIDWREDFASKR